MGECFSKSSAEREEEEEEEEPQELRRQNSEAESVRPVTICESYSAIREFYRQTTIASSTTPCQSVIVRDPTIGMN